MLFLLYLLLLPLASAHNISTSIRNLLNESKEISRVGQEDPSTFFYLFNGFLVILFFLAISASLIDYYVTSDGTVEKLNSRTGWKILFSFSIPRNTTNLFSIGEQSADTVLCLDAIKFIRFTWVASYSASFAEFVGEDTLKLYKIESDYILSDAILNAYPSVDTFFVFSGLVVANTFFNKVLKDDSFACDRLQWMLYYVQRWLRHAPSYILFIGLFVAWTPLLSDDIGFLHDVQNCESYWWLNVLYLNNFNSVDKMCYSISWFFSVDTQLYWIAPLFLLAIYYSWKSGLSAMIGGALFSIGITIFLTVYYDLPATVNSARAFGNVDYATYIYQKPWTRLIPYIVGILCGYFIVLVRQKVIVIRQPKKWEVTMCWLIAAIFALTVEFSPYDYIRGEADWSVAFRALYACFSHIGWSMALGWLILACTFGWAGPVKTILEHPLWYPFGRLSPCAYLVHWFVRVLYQPANPVSVWNTYMTATVPLVFLSYVVAFVWSCLVDLPFVNIGVIVVELLTNKRSNGSNNTTSVTSSVNTSEADDNESIRFTAIEVDK